MKRSSWMRGLVYGWVGYWLLRLGVSLGEGVVMIVVLVVLVILLELAVEKEEREKEV